MQNVSKAYKDSMKGMLRNRGYIKVTLGVINSEAQKNVSVDYKQNSFTEFSNTTKPFNGYTVGNIYATAEQDFSKVDGSMYFLPEDGNYFNNGIVTQDILGSVYISFQGVLGLDIKGLTIDFGECYPTDFIIENEAVKRIYEGNSTRYFVTEDTFDGTSYLIITPSKMVNGQGRLRIYQFSCGIVNTFTNKETKKYTQKEFVSSISETIPSMDMSLTVDNQDLYYSPDNPESTLAYFEQGQEMKVSFGYDVLDNGVIEWLPEQTAYIKSWSATDTEAKFTATDRFDYMKDKYYRGMYRESGISLYDLAVDVFKDLGITDEREYFIDPYLKNVIVYNPMPVVKHSEALQIISNAGRCALYEDRRGRIHLQSSFVPDMFATANNEEDFSNISNILNDSEKDAYALASNDFSLLDGNLFFIPEDNNYLNMGYISSSIWYQVPENTITPRLSLRLGGTQTKYLDDYGYWSEEVPKITINLEASFVEYGLVVRFRNVAPREFVIRTYNEEVAVDEFVFQNPDLEFVTYEQFNLFNKMEIEFTKGYPNSRVFVDSILIGDVTDYVLSRKNALTDAPTAKRQNKIKSINVKRTLYKKNTTEIKDVVTEDLILGAGDTEHTVYFNNPCTDLSVVFEDDAGNIIENSSVTATIIDYSNFYATILFSGIESDNTVAKYKLQGYEYVKNEQWLVKKYNDIGEVKEWSNPLISTVQLASDLEEWLSEYFLGDVEYQIKWRGDPRTDANDLFYLDLKDREKVLIRAYQNELKFSGAWSGTLKARKAVVSWR